MPTASKKGSYFYGLGRRKSATARIRVTGGKGSLIINGKEAADYFAGNKMYLHELVNVFTALELDPEKFDVSVKVSGGGHSSQIDAISLGIAKAMVEMTPDYRATLRRADLLGRDPREKERKKFGLKGARKKRQFTKR